ncbi:MAG: PilN domain-containing protein [Bacillota bacterium]
MIRINLLPPEYRPQPQVKFIRLVALFGIVVGGMLVVGGLGWAWYYRESLKMEIQKIDQRRAEYGPTYDKVIGMERDLAAIEKQLATREKLVAGLLNPVAILQSMEGMVPKNVAYVSFSVSSDRKVAITGNASDYYGVAALQLKLSLSGIYQDVHLRGANAGSGGLVSFSLDCTLSEGALKP